MQSQSLEEGGSRKPGPLASQADRFRVFEQVVRTLRTSSPPRDPSRRQQGAQRTVETHGAVDEVDLVAQQDVGASTRPVS